jgi:hypothetical protein
MLGQVGSAWRTLVAACTELPRAGLRGGVPLRLRNFRVHRAARLGEGERVSVDQFDMCTRRWGRAPGGAAVGAGARVPLERGYV